MRIKILNNNGSVQNIEGIPKRIKNLYKTAWEIPQTTLIDQAADRGAFICQSQSLNIFMENANFGKLTSTHFYGWEKGLKTGMYSLKTKASQIPLNSILTKQLFKTQQEIQKRKA